MATVCLPYTRGASATRSSRGHEVQEWLCESTRRRRAAQITAEESQPTRAGSALTGRPRDESRSTRQIESLDSESPSREPKLTPGKRGGHLEENLEAEAARSTRGNA